MELVKGAGRLSEVGPGAGEEVVGVQALVGCAVAVEVVDEAEGEGRVGEQRVALVAGLEGVEVAAHAPAVGARQQEQQAHEHRQ